MTTRISILLGILMTFYCALPAWAEEIDPAEAFDNAAAAYTLHDYEASIREYEKVIESGSEFPELYNNLGCAYAKNDELGMAIVSFRKARRLSPRLSDLEHNLEYVRNKTESRIRGWHPTGWLKVPLFAHYYLTFAEEALLAIALYLIASVLWILWRLRLARWGKTAALITSVVLATLVLSLGVRYSAETPGTAVIVAEKADVLSSPTGGETVVFELFDGEEIKVLERRDGWMKVGLSEEYRGWVSELDAIVP